MTSCPRRSPRSSWGPARSSEHVSRSGGIHSPLPALPGSDPSEREQLSGVQEASEVRARRGGNARAELLSTQPRGRGQAPQRRRGVGVFGARLDQEREGRGSRAAGRKRGSASAGRAALLHLRRRRLRPERREGHESRDGRSGSAGLRSVDRVAASVWSVGPERNPTWRGIRAEWDTTRGAIAASAVGAEWDATAGDGVGPQRDAAEEVARTIT